MMVNQRRLIQKRIKNKRTSNIVRHCHIWIKKNYIKKLLEKEFSAILAMQNIKEVIQILNLVRTQATIKAKSN